MYKTFYSFNDNPFGMSPNPKFLFGTAATREALACLQYGISSRKGFIVLTGEVGTGKTILLRTALEAVRANNVHTSFVFNPRLDMAEFLEFVLSDFGVPCESRTKSSMLMALNKWLIECYARNEICVLVVDESQNLSNEMLEEIRLLTNLETSSEKLLQIVLSGQPEFEERMRMPALRQLRQRISLWCRTVFLTQDETAAYVRHRLQVAGSDKKIFSDPGLALIHRYSRGIPRIINLICEHSLIFGFADQVQEIQEIIIHDVANDLDLNISRWGSTDGTESRQAPRHASDDPNKALTTPHLERSI